MNNEPNVQSVQLTKKQVPHMSLVEEAEQLLDQQTPTEPTQGISTVGVADGIEDPSKIVAINQDKLKGVDDKKIVDAFKVFDRIGEEREALNAEAADIRANLKKLGIPSKALNAAYQRYTVEERKRVEHDAAFAKCCNALGVGYQSGLFDNV